MAVTFDEALRAMHRMREMGGAFLRRRGYTPWRWSEPWDQITWRWPT